jgi:hypothetical protein
MWHDGVRMAQHERSYSRLQQILDLEHYLEVLEHKPGARADLSLWPGGERKGAGRAAMTFSGN